MGSISNFFRGYIAKCMQGINRIYRDNNKYYTPAKPMSQRAQNYFENTLQSKWNSKQESALKKIITASAYISKASGAVLPDSLNTKKPLDMAFAADESLDTVKASYQIGNGTATLSDYLENKSKKILARAEVVAHNTIDKVAEKVKTCADKAVDWVVDKGVDVVMDKVSNIIPVKRLKPMVKSFVSNAAPKVKNIVRTGIDKIANGCKKVVSYMKGKVQNTVKNALGKTVSFLKSWF